MILVTLGVTVAAFAIGELLLSLPASRIPRAQADELVDEALEDFERREERRELDEHLRLFQLRRSLKGDSFTPAAYLREHADPDTEEGKLVRQELAAAEQAAVEGKHYTFTSIHAKVFFHMTEQQKQRRKK